MNNTTPDYYFSQLYQQHVAERVDIRWHKPKGFYTPLKISDGYSPARPPHATQTLKMTFQGKYIHAHVMTETKLPPNRTRRGKITDFSGQSRRRLLDLFHRFAVTTKPVFLTLTYGEDYPDAKTAKNQLRAFLERIRRFVPQGKTSCVWRMEFQERGAPHFHLIFFNLPFIKKEAIQRMWGSIIRQDRPFTRIEMIRSHRALMGYVSKYIAKVNPSEDSGFNSPTYLHAYIQKHGEYVGRMWGVFNRDNLPFAELIEFDVPYTPAKFYKFRNVAIALFPPIQDYISPSFRLYVPNVQRWLEIFHHLYDEHF